MMMKLSRTLAIAAAIGSLGLISANVLAATVADPDIFGGSETVTTSSFFNSFFDGTEGNIVNGASNSFVFENDDTDQRLSITGFNSAIDSLRFFDTPSYTDRLGTDVIVYYSTSSTTSLNPIDYTLVGTYELEDTSLHVYDTATSPVDNPAAGEPAVDTGATISFADASGLEIPAGTQSILLRFTSSSYRGLGLSEIQAFSIPEPSTMVMLMLGAATLVTRRRQK